MIVENRSAYENCREILRKAQEKPKAVYETNRHLDPPLFDAALRDSEGLLAAADAVYREVHAGRKTVEDYRLALIPWWKAVMRRLREAAAQAMDGGAN